MTAPVAPWLTPTPVALRRVAATLGAALLLALAGCAALPPPDRPVPPTASGYTAGPLALASAPSDPAAQQLASGEALAQDWWTLFGSPDIDRLVRSALAGNRDLAAARATLEQARALEEEAQRAAVGPQGELTAGLGRQKYGKEFLGTLASIPPFSYFALGAAISDSFDFGDTSTHRIAQRAALAEYQRQQLRAAWLTVTGAAVRDWIEAASTRAQVAAWEDLQSLDRQRLDLLQQSRAAGAATSMEVAAAEARVAEDGAELPPLRQQLAVAQTRLAILQGQAPASAPVPATPLAAITLPRRLPVALPSELAHRRPDILAAEAQLQASTEALGIAHAAFYPHILLSASTGLQATEPSALFDRDSGVFGLGAGFSAPFLNRGALKAQQRAAAEAMHASADRYQQTVLQAFGQVAEALQALDNDAAQVSARTAQESAAARESALLRTSREAGNTGLLPVLDAQRRERLAALERTRATARQLLDTVTLFVALGGADPAANSDTVAGAAAGG